MGGSSYNVGVGRSSGGRSYSTDADRTYSKVKKAHPDVLPTGDRRVWTDAKNPIVIALDVTGSMGDSAKIMFDKIPMFWGQVEQKGYLPDPAVSFVAIGDVYSDEAPLQVTQFEKAKAIHPWLEKIWLEGHGGGQTMESYDLAALFFLDKCSVPKMEHGFFFFIGDEGYYPELDGRDTVPIFEGLMEKFDTFFIHWSYKQGGSDDDRIVKDWKKIMGERFLILKDPKAIVDVMLGLIAMRMQVRNLASYKEDLKDKGQTEERIDGVAEVIKDFEDPNLPATVGSKDVSTSRPVLLSNRDVFRSRKIGKW